MAQYKAVFVKVDGLADDPVGNITCRLEATGREQAEAEALALPRPEEANFVKLIRDGLYEGPPLGFAL